MFARRLALLVALFISGFFGSAWAEPSWVQIEAKPTEAEAMARAAAWAATFPNVGGFVLGSGWYAVALGPFSQAEAVAQAELLRREGMIPSDAFVADEARFRQRFWPASAATTATTAPAAAPNEPGLPGETLAAARTSEGRLSAGERMALQEALQWQGYYTSGIDGAFGPGTRASMAAWQGAIGAERTGVLTSAQRDDLLTRSAAERAALGLADVRDEEAAISVIMPTGLVKFERYEPPFAVYGARDGSGVQVLLISQQGDQTALFTLYDIMQNFEIVPLEGARSREANRFVLSGQNAEIYSHTEVSLRGGLIKGFTLVWPAADAVRMARVLAAMQGSFTPLGNRAMDASLGEPLSIATADLLSGIDLRKPSHSRTGFYLTAAGAVLTTADAAAGCGRVTVDGAAFDTAFVDAATGIAVLTPRVALAPQAVAAFLTLSPRLETEVAVAGFPYADAISAPVLTFGRLAAMSGLGGEADLARLRLVALPGDAGGPVLDPSGAVLGVLLPADTSGTRILPDDLALARQTSALVALLTERGFAPVSASSTGAMAPEDLARLARKLAVQVSCWK
ncbi:serine protease [Phaeovulum sp.]|uniref:serine protease n=1 Tax=Phaeovulum sp. TaxID=2934796 RepID=UPI00272F80D2|nr:serine protease [Phaeovulum sp.]MDP1669462.1 serine protease [Phaeovulum sp.]MDZ4118259.1 serine protease [Phaeovulum sp.]